MHVWHSSIFNDGEYEKAAVLYDKLFKQNENNDFYFDRYVECLLTLEEFEEAEKAIKRQLKRTPKECEAVRNLRQAFRTANPG